MKINRNNIWNIEISLITYWELQKGNIIMTFLMSTKMILKNLESYKNGD